MSRLDTAREGVKNAADLCRTFTLQNFQNPVNAFAGVDQERFVRIPGQTNHFDKHFLLHQPRHAGLSVKPDLADSNRPGMGQQTPQFSRVFRLISIR